MRWSLLALGLSASILSPSPGAIAASPIEQIRSSSNLPGLDLEKIKRGAIISARGPLASFPRGVYTEACFFVRAPVESVGAKLLHWDTTKHPELEVSILREYPLPPPANIFDSLPLKESQPKDKWLIDRTWQMFASGQPGELFVTPSEAAAAHASQPSQELRDPKASEFWRKILAARGRSLASGGLSGLPHYSAAGADIAPRNEFDSLIRMAPKIAQHFQPITSTKPLNENGNADDSVAYWQQTLVRHHTTLHAGFVSALKRSTSWQTIDCTYFISDTYFLSFTLCELFPIENGTLVWQIDFVSAPFRSYLGGTDRFFAGKEIVKETAKTIQLFRTDVEKQ